ncbi:MAG: response regulator [Opitutales bacterium]
MRQPNKETPAPKLPAHFPWAVLIASRNDGRILYANKTMKSEYLLRSGQMADDLRVDERFTFPNGEVFPEMLEKRDTAKPWNLRAVPQGNRHGIDSVELMAYEDPDDPDCIWLCAMEHPVVRNTIRFSSRSELHILQVLLDNTLEYIFFRDSRGRFIMTNKAFRSVIGAESSDSAVGQTIDAYVQPESADWLAGIDAEIRATGRPSVNNASLFHFKSGTRQWLQMTTVPVYNSEDGFVGSVSVARDISEQKKTEAELREAMDEARKANQAKSEFLATMSHEIRTPINGIIGSADLCQETELDSEQKDYLHTIVECGNTLLALINDLLDFSKIEAGELNLEKLRFSPSALLDELAGEFLPSVRKKNIELIVFCEPAVPPYLMGDSYRLKQILRNLMSNAVKFTEEQGEVYLKAGVLEKDDSLCALRFSVADTGVGIAPDRHDAIFSCFTQEDMSTTRKYGGTGLGLAITKNLVGFMDGVIAVDSEPGKGSVFSVEIPFEVSGYPTGEAIAFDPELVNMRVLIVDDNKTNRDLYAAMFTNWGYRAEAIAGAEEAFQALEQAVAEQDPFRLLVLDQQMPIMTGLDLAEHIRKHPDLKEIRMLLLSSSLNRSEAKRAEALGIARALSKPVKRSVLHSVVKETFGDTAQEEETAHAADASDVKHMEKMSGELDVLVAEDNPVNRKIAQRHIEKMGHRVTVVSDGEEAVRLVENAGRYDCILMDLQMPGMDGYEATRAIRDLEARNERDPHFIVAMTAHVLPGDVDRCFESGMDEYIAKPFRLQRLKEVLTAVDGQAVAGDEAETHKKRPEERSEEGRSNSSMLSDMDSEEARIAAAEFLEVFPKEIEKLEHMVQKSDIQAIAFAVHAIKGMVGFFAASPVLEKFDRIEMACNKGMSEALISLADELIATLHQLADELKGC